MKSLITASLVLCGFMSFAQSDSGLIAHYKFTGNGADSSGNAHHGAMYNVSTGTGQDGVSGHALYFNGTNSYIQVPYAADFELTEYTICVTLKPQGLNTSICQNEYFITKGGFNSTGHWAAFMFDGPFDPDCATADTTGYVFANENGTNLPAISQWQYTPTILSNTWYRVVTTYSSGTYKVFVNGTLMSTVINPTPVAIGTVVKDIYIGSNDGGPVGTYPYDFKGMLDDIRVYNRVITDSEVNLYTPNDTSLAIAEPLRDNGISVYPNPATERLVIRNNLAATGASEGTYRIYSAIGEMVTILVTIKDQAELDVSALVPGNYFVTFTNSKGLFTTRFLKK